MTQRVPEYLSRNDPTLQNCLTLLRAVWQRKYEQVYTILRQLPWPEALKPVVESYDGEAYPHFLGIWLIPAYIAYFQEKTLKEVSKAYGAIRLEAAASYLGLDTAAAEKGDPNIVQKFTACGWRWDAEAELLYPKAVPTETEKDIPLSTELSQIMALIGQHKG